MYEGFLRLANPERYRARAKASYNRHKEKRLAQSARYYRANKDFCLSYRQGWYQRNKVRVLKRYKTYAAAHPEIRLKCQRNWRNTPIGKLRTRISGRIRKALRSRGIRKCDKTMRLVGCSIHELRRYIESLFLPGMSWENSNLWHIDHIRPLAAFNLTDAKEQTKANHFTNLRPLWAIDNILKGGRVLSRTT